MSVKEDLTNKYLIIIGKIRLWDEDPLVFNKNGGFKLWTGFPIFCESFPYLDPIRSFFDGGMGPRHSPFFGTADYQNKEKPAPPGIPRGFTF
jgi:hypothetical protein